MICAWAVPSTCPPSPTARRRVPFKCPGAEAGSRGWRCGCRSTRAHRSPHTSQVTVQSQRRRLTSKGRASSGSRLPAAPKAPPASAKVGLGAAGKDKRECSPSAERGLGGTLIKGAAGLWVSPRPHAQECQGCGLSTAACRALIPEMYRNAPPPSAFIRWFFAPKPSGRHWFTRPREDSSSVPFPRACSQVPSALQTESQHPFPAFGTLSAVQITGGVARKDSAALPPGKHLS